MRCLVLNIGNTHLSAGLFQGKKLLARFKSPTKGAAKAFVAELEPHAGTAAVDRIAISSVVPALTPKLVSTLQRRCQEPVHLLTHAAPHGLRLAYRQPERLGMDRLAACLGARAQLGQGNLIVLDFGTATTVTALTCDNLLAGGAILPGLGLWAEALALKTAQLPHITLGKPVSVLGRSPEEAIESGLYHGHAGAVQNLSKQIGNKAFGEAPWRVVATGGNASLFRREKLFTRLIPDLILHGLLAFASAQTHHA